MSIDTYRDPLFIKWYTDLSGQKVSVQRTNEQYKVVRNKVVLTEIPDEFYKVQIPGLTERKVGTVLSSTEFSVNYTLGEISFHSSKEAQTITITSYYSRGVIYYPASRVWTKLSDDCSVIEETFQDFVDSIASYQYIGEYDNLISYSMNNMTLYNGSVYICSAPTSLGNLPTNTTKWRILAAGFSTKTDFNVLAQYFPRDIVYYEDALYCCRQKPSIGTLPANATYWTEMISVKQLVTNCQSQLSAMQALELNIEETESLRVSAENARIDAEISRVSSENNRTIVESARVNAENTRIASENNRISAENERVASESNRVSAESVRVNSEGTRVSAENARAASENTRFSNESNRIDKENLRETAENTRFYNENDRVDAENTRVSAENTRLTNESSRIAAENTRAGDESSRITAETARELAENTRQIDESTRQSNEATRETNEVARQQMLSNFNHLGAYSASTTYQPKNIVSYNGSSYMCILQSLNHLPTDSMYWKLIAQKGADGTDLIFRGNYDSGTSYIVSDLVTYNGSAYACIKNTTGNLPTNSIYWTVFLYGSTSIIISDTMPSNPYEGLFWIDTSM